MGKEIREREGGGMEDEEVREKWERKWRSRVGRERSNGNGLHLVSEKVKTTEN